MISENVTPDEQKLVNGIATGLIITLAALFLTAYGTYTLDLDTAILGVVMLTLVYPITLVLTVVYALTNHLEQATPEPGEALGSAMEDAMGMLGDVEMPEEKSKEGESDGK